MGIFYLQDYQVKSSSMSPTIISAENHIGYVVDRTVSADSWIDAKREFGFELSATQEFILAKRKEAK